jgi:hypothetical protein
MLAKLLYQIYFTKACFYAFVAIDFFVIALFVFAYADLVPWLQGEPALRFNVIREGKIVEAPVTDYFNCFYFSVTTQMTVGFGDIIPATNLAKLMASAQATFGYFYLAVLVSMLVGRAFSAQSVQSILDSPRNN